MMEKVYRVTFWRSTNEDELPINSVLTKAYSYGEAIRHATYDIGDWTGEVDHVTVNLIPMK